MITLPLRELLRRPADVKKLTAAGESVQITDNGKPLWVVRSARDDAPDEAELQMLDDELDAMLSSRPTDVSAAQLVIESRVL